MTQVLPVPVEVVARARHTLGERRALAELQAAAQAEPASRAVPDNAPDRSVGILCGM
jgi:hypothetical protein